ncbi:helix-turn-helix domain-containing protein [Nocardia terpenica]|uniref:helix-turn-helix domain-containing protein n=1 Tax=Nocardia terpenica TaxID=455432 RepID=UPI0009EEF824|nr:helix-turn-helix domain-containing protein [Nocardia terpenica]NQE85690.1 helix-turn-helix domain-containing protein [Nocardia terpenica]
METGQRDSAAFGARLRAAREAAGVSLAALAARTHFSKSLLGLLETGQRQGGRARAVSSSRLDRRVTEIERLLTT